MTITWKDENGNEWRLMKQRNASPFTYTTASPSDTRRALESLGEEERREALEPFLDETTQLLKSCLSRCANACGGHTRSTNTVAFLKFVPEQVEAWVKKLAGSRDDMMRERDRLRERLDAALVFIKGDLELFRECRRRIAAHLPRTEDTAGLIQKIDDTLSGPSFPALAEMGKTEKELRERVAELEATGSKMSPEERSAWQFCGKLAEAIAEASGYTGPEDPPLLEQHIRGLRVRVTGLELTETALTGHVAEMAKAMGEKDARIRELEFEAKSRAAVAADVHRVLVERAPHYAKSVLSSAIANVIDGKDEVIRVRDTRIAALNQELASAESVHKAREAEWVRERTALEADLAKAKECEYHDGCIHADDLFKVVELVAGKRISLPTTTPGAKALAAVRSLSAVVEAAKRWRATDEDGDEVGLLLDAIAEAVDAIPSEPLERCDSRCGDHRCTKLAGHPFAHGVQGAGIVWGVEQLGLEAAPSDDARRIRWLQEKVRAGRDAERELLSWTPPQSLGIPSEADGPKPRGAHGVCNDCGGHHCEDGCDADRCDCAPPATSLPTDPVDEAGGEARERRRMLLLMTSKKRAGEAYKYSTNPGAGVVHLGTALGFMCELIEGLVADVESLRRDGEKR